MSHRITDWDPEDVPAWEAGNKNIARRNLIWSVVAEHIGFSVWSIWSVMVLFMPEAVYGFSAGDKFLLGATATLVGGCLRIPYTLATATFGGRNWTVFSAFVLLIPTVGTMLLLAHPGLPLWPYLVCAALAGLGGGNFASSMTNINAFYPQRLKGWALGINAGGGNIGHMAACDRAHRVRADRVEVVERAVHVARRKIVARHRRHERVRAGGQHQRVVVDARHRRPSALILAARSIAVDAAYRAAARRGRRRGSRCRGGRAGLRSQCSV